MAVTKRGLGKGLSALIPGAENDNTQNNTNIEEQKGVIELEIDSIIPNKNQPRKTFDSDKIRALSESIKEHGIIQPIIVNKESGKYVIIAGERRWRAAKQAGLKQVPVVVKEISKKELMELSLIENIQREDLNPIEEAIAYESLINEYGFTHETLGTSVGKSRSSITNSLRLLTLTKKGKEALVAGNISVGHAKVLLSLNDKKKIDRIIDIICEKEISIKETEKLVKKITDISISDNTEENTDENEKIALAVKTIENALSKQLMTRVKINAKKGKGKIIIEYYSNEELERLIDKIGEKKNG